MTENNSNNSNNPSYEDFVHDFLESLANDLEAEEMAKKYEIRQEQESLYFYLLTYLVVDFGLDVALAQVGAAQEVMTRFKLQEWTIPNFLSDNRDDYPF